MSIISIPFLLFQFIPYLYFNQTSIHCLNDKDFQLLNSVHCYHVLKEDSWYCKTDLQIAAHGYINQSSPGVFEFHYVAFDTEYPFKFSEIQNNNPNQHLAKVAYFVVDLDKGQRLLDEFRFVNYTSPPYYNGDHIPDNMIIPFRDRIIPRSYFTQWHRGRRDPPVCHAGYCTDACKNTFRSSEAVKGFIGLMEGKYCHPELSSKFTLSHIYGSSIAKTAEPLCCWNKYTYRRVLQRPTLECNQQCSFEEWYDQFHKYEYYAYDIRYDNEAYKLLCGLVLMAVIYVLSFKFGLLPWLEKNIAESNKKIN